MKKESLQAEEEARHKAQVCREEARAEQQAQKSIGAPSSWTHARCREQTAQHVRKK